MSAKLHSDTVRHSFYVKSNVQKMNVINMNVRIMIFYQVYKKGQSSEKWTKVHMMCFQPLFNLAIINILNMTFG